jgi:hypothetical protein
MINITEVPKIAETDLSTMCRMLDKANIIYHRCSKPFTYENYPDDVYSILIYYGRSDRAGYLQIIFTLSGELIKIGEDIGKDLRVLSEYVGDYDAGA